MENEAVKPINLNNGRIVITGTNAAIMYTLVVLLVFFTLITPRDALGIKKGFLFLSLVFGAIPIAQGIGKNIKLMVFAIALPLLMYCVSTLDTGSPFMAFSQLYPFVYLLLFFPIIQWNIDVKQIALYVGNIMATIIIVSSVLDLVGVLSIYSNPILNYLNDNGEAKISKSVNAMFRYVLFFNASPILFFNLAHYVKANKKVFSILILVALLFTGTRANIFLGMAILVGGVLFFSKRPATKVVAIIGLIAIAALFGGELIERYYVLADAKATGDLTRTAGLSSILHALNTHKQYWFTGMGFGSSYYNAGRGELLQTSELSYMEFIREIGLPLALCVFGFLLYPLIKLLKRDRFLFMAYGAYLFASIFEPFIFTSTGFLVVLIVYVEVHRFNDNISRDLVPERSA